ncbi:MAG: DUF484 family protein [Acetobacteraceae bacterium]|nr:DUF484 family protein [Acetobacteraceae bacterium]MDW8399705.1 DUF484 family protein [Acetobacteraceae bacterium]
MTKERAPSAEQVAASLRAHPSFLAERPELHESLAPPRRVHGEVLADHMAAMVEAARRQAKGLAEEMAAYTAEERAENTLSARAQEAVLALIAAPDAVDCALADWPRLLGVEQISLCAEGSPPAPIRPLPAGTFARLLPPGRDAYVRPFVTDAEALHGEVAPLITRDALARIRLPAREILLVLGAREAEALPPRGAGQALDFLARALAAAILR